MTKLVDQGTADEAGGPRDQDSHPRRVYWRACWLLAAVLLAAGCDHGKRRVEPPPPPPHVSLLALDREHQSLVRDYEPVSRALARYEVAYRNRRATTVKGLLLRFYAESLAATVDRSLARIRRDPVSGETAQAKHLLVAALEARRRALAEPPGSPAYRLDWDRSVVKARRALTLLQDIRDRARLIPLPEDAVS